MSRASRSSSSSGVSRSSVRPSGAGTPPLVGLWKPIDKAAVIRGECSNPGRSMEPFEREGWARAVAQQSLDACPVLTLDAHRRIDAEASRSLPGEHAVGVGFVEEALRAEVTKHAPLHDTLKIEPVGPSELAGPVEGGVSVAGSREHTVEHDEMVDRSCSVTSRPIHPDRRQLRSGEPGRLVLTHHRQT